MYQRLVKKPSAGGGGAGPRSGEPFLAPIEGDLEVAESLIPLKWFYKELESCKARQKVLVLDVNRFNPVDPKNCGADCANVLAAQMIQCGETNSSRHRVRHGNNLRFCRSGAV